MADCIPLILPMNFRPNFCVNPTCKFSTIGGGTFWRKGFFKLKRNSQKIRRFQCSHCLKTLSSHTYLAKKYQKKPEANFGLFLSICRGSTIRDAAKTTNVTYKTAFKKIYWMAELCRPIISKNLQSDPPPKNIYFDEMESIEQTKCKPLSLPLAVDDRYRILSVKVASMPCKGPLAEVSRRKYGPREDHRPQAFEEVFQSLQDFFPNAEVLKTDSKPEYVGLIKKHFPKAQHQRFLSRARKDKETPFETKQKRNFDPMFPLNQRCAKLRAQLKTLSRRTWCTPKRAKNLELLLQLFTVYNNGYQEQLKALV